MPCAIVKDGIDRSLGGLTLGDEAGEMLMECVIIRLALPHGRGMGRCAGGGQVGRATNAFRFPLRDIHRLCICLTDFPSFSFFSDGVCASGHSLGEGAGRVFGWALGDGWGLYGPMERTFQMVWRRTWKRAIRRRICLPWSDRALGLFWVNQVPIEECFGKTVSEGVIRSMFVIRRGDDIGCTSSEVTHGDVPVGEYAPHIDALPKVENIWRGRNDNALFPLLSLLCEMLCKENTDANHILHGVKRVEKA